MFPALGVVLGLLHSVAGGVLRRGLKFKTCTNTLNNFLNNSGYFWVPHVNLIMIWTDILFNFPEGKKILFVYPAIQWVLQALYLEGKSGRYVGLTTRLQLVSRLRMIGDILPRPPYSFMSSAG